MSRHNAMYIPRAISARAWTIMSVRADASVPVQCRASLTPYNLNCSFANVTCTEISFPNLKLPSHSSKLAAFFGVDLLG